VNAKAAMYTITAEGNVFQATLPLMRDALRGLAMSASAASMGGPSMMEFAWLPTLSAG
jgi:hypothetical protein